MSAPSSTTSSPAHIQPLHHPNQAAQVQVPQAPLGNTTNMYNGASGAKALLAKKMAKANNPSTVSPTDNMMTPCTAKIAQTKKKHFAKGPVKALSFGAPAEEDEDEDEKSPSPVEEQKTQ
ncbi:hypothetical protein FRC00_014069 [Tulasnella sp. 408]|nr:hypothetical protein FRC00_014069 [Tulasnella sp. 408]